MNRAQILGQLRAMRDGFLLGGSSAHATVVDQLIGRIEQSVPQEVSSIEDAITQVKRRIPPNVTLTLTIRRDADEFL